MATKSIIHEQFMESLRIVKREAKTENERIMADLLLTMYPLVAWHQPVIDLVNQFANEAMEASDES